MKAGWKHSPLGELCNIAIGKTPSRGSKSFWDAEKTSNNVWLSIADLHNTNANVVSDSKEYLTDKGAAICKLVKEGTLLASFKLTLGRLAFAGRDLYTNEAIASLVVREESQLSKKYLYYYLEYFDWDLATGGDVKLKGKTLNKKKLSEIPIYYPSSLNEQYRIIASLEKVYEDIAVASANAEKNLKSSQALLASYLKSIFDTQNEEWKKRKFGEIIDFLTDYHANGSYEVLKANVELKEVEDYAWMVRSTDFEKNFEGAFRYISQASYEFLSKTKIFGGELIMSKIGNAGKVYLMPKVERPCSLAMNLFLIRLDNKKAIPDFIYNYLRSPSGEAQINSRLLGMATKTITKDNVRSIMIPVPSLATQNHVIDKLNILRHEVLSLEKIYLKKIDALRELKKSILNQVFGGQLQ